MHKVVVIFNSWFQEWHPSSTPTRFCMPNIRSKKLIFIGFHVANTCFQVLSKIVDLFFQQHTMAAEYMLTTSKFKYQSKSISSIAFRGTYKGDRSQNLLLQVHAIQIPKLFFFVSMSISAAYLWILSIELKSIKYVKLSFTLED